MVPSDTGEPRSAVVRERIEALLAEVELPPREPAHQQCGVHITGHPAVHTCARIHCSHLVVCPSNICHGEIWRNSKNGRTRRSVGLALLVRLAAAVTVLDACLSPSARHADAMCRSYVPSAHVFSIRALPPPARACHPTMLPRLSGAHINPAVERIRTHRDHAALLPARARCRRGLRVRAPGRARPRAEPAPRARVGRAADQCASCDCAARERRLTRGGR
jgi:hypothetical protein